MQEPVVIAKNLSLTFRSPDGRRVGVGTAEDGLSFEVEKGEIFGVIGPDGAGKTTLFRLLASLMLPQSGEAWVAGYNTDYDYKPLREKIGYMPGSFSLYPDLTVEENLNFFSTIFDTTVEENYHLVEDIYKQIEPFKHRKAKALSGGMKQKLALSCALIHAPTVLFLDEPTTGIDPISRVDLWNMLHKLSDMGVTILVSTPYMDEAAQCDRIAFMQYGQFTTLETPQSLTDRYPLPIYELRHHDRLHLLKHLRQMERAVTSFAFGETFHVTTEEGVTEQEVIDFINLEPKLSGTKIRRIKPTLEDAFLLMTQEEEIHV